jgi:multiple sugar transport system ATP-binding protein
MASIRFEKVEKAYPGHVAVHPLDLEIADGELLVLVGPSGCGKSTTLRMIAGLETPTGGRIFLGDRDVTNLPPQERDIAMVFQSYALYPHKTVRANLEFALRMRGVSPDVMAERVERAAGSLGLTELLDRKPGQLSGGQRQRVALGRAIVREPKAFLLDEPLSNLDAKLRVQTRAELARLHRRLGATMVYVTHDQEEAMTLGDRVALLRDGKLQQVDPPMTMYRRPANAFVAGFIGSPAMNFFTCSLSKSNGQTILESSAFKVALDSAPAGSAGECLLGVRPQHVRVAEGDGADFSARVDVIQPLGSEVLVVLELPGSSEESNLTAIVPPDTPLEVNQTITLRLDREHLHLFDRDGNRRLN